MQCVVQLRPVGDINREQIKMFKICTLNGSSSEAESDTEQNQVEIKEAQEAHLLALYNTALQQLGENNKAGAKTNLLEISTPACCGQVRGVNRSRKHFVLQCP